MVVGTFVIRNDQRPGANNEVIAFERVFHGGADPAVDLLREGIDRREQGNGASGQTHQCSH